MTGILVVGNGLAAHRLADRLRHHGHPETVTVLGAEPRPAYHRQLLSYSVSGLLAPEALHLPPPPGAVVRQGTVVTHIDRARRQVRALQDGTESVHPYGTLVLATGARPTVPDIPGASRRDGSLTPGVATLRTAADCERIGGGTVVVLGGGPLGVETATALATRGSRTTLVCSGPHPLHERLGETGGAMLTERLEQAGVTVLGGRTAVRRTPDGVLLGDGTALRADSLVLCTGVIPEVRLARAAGLDVRGGIVVDDELRTSDPHIHAVGDCAEHGARTLGGVDAAWAQAEALAAHLAGRAAPYRPVSAVFRLRTSAADVACIGSPADAEGPGVRTVTLADRAEGRYARLALREERVVAAVLLGLPQAIAALGALHRDGRRLPADRLGLLLGWQPRPATSAADENEDALICLCNNVRRQVLAQAWRSGARTVAALATATRATTSCGGCEREVAELAQRMERGARRGTEHVA